MSTARPLSSLLSAGAVVALTLAAPGTALADPGAGAGSQKGSGKAAEQADGKDKGKKPRAGTAEGQPAGPADSSKRETSSSGKAADKPAKQEPARQKPAKEKPAANEPAATTADTASPADAKGDPAGNNGTIKIDTVPGDPDRANRPHPGCAFVLQFFGFDAGQTADITFTGQAPTRSAGPLLSLSGQAISTTPADGALEDGHSLTFTAADLGLVGTPTAAKGWHVKVAVDALEAPGGAKQKVFWLDCPSAGAATVTEDEVQEEVQEGVQEEVDGTVDGKPADVRSEQLEQPVDAGLAGFGEGVGVLSGSATRELSSASAQSGAAGVSGEAAAGTAAGSVASGSTSVLPSSLPFTGPAGLAAMLAAGVGALGAGALALRAGRRRQAAAGADTSAG